MNPLVKYSVFFFMLSLTSYSQLFMPMVCNSGYSLPGYDAIQSPSDKTMISKVVEKEFVIIEEEEKEDDERFLVRKLPQVFAVLSFGHAPDVFQARLMSHLSFTKNNVVTSCASFSGGTCRILRL